MMPRKAPCSSSLLLVLDMQHHQLAAGAAAAAAWPPTEVVWDAAAAPALLLNPKCCLENGDGARAGSVHRPHPPEKHQGGSHTHESHIALLQRERGGGN